MRGLARQVGDPENGLARFAYEVDALAISSAELKGPQPQPECASRSGYRLKVAPRGECLQELVSGCSRQAQPRDDIGRAQLLIPTEEQLKDVQPTGQRWDHRTHGQRTSLLDVPKDQARPSVRPANINRICS